MKNDVGEYEIRESALRGDGGELGLVSRVDLETKADSEHEGGHAGDEAREKGVKGEGSNQAAIEELEHSGEENVNQVGIDNLELLKNDVFIQMSTYYSDH